MDPQTSATINPRHTVPRLLSTGHFRTRPGYVTVRDHGTRDWLLFYTLGGTGRIAHLNGFVNTRPGDCVILPPGLPHDYRIGPGCDLWEFQWAHFLPWSHWYGLLSWPTTYPGVKYLRVDDTDTHQRVTDALESMCRHATSPLRQRELFAMNALEKALLWLNSINPELTHGRFDARIRRAMDHICRNIGQRLTVESVARQCGLSASRLSHLFREQVGLTVVQYLEQQRLNRGRELLEVSSFSVSEIATMVGYESPFYFSRRFSAFTGQSPRAYRRELAGRGEPG
jgi:AraC family transcriptional regulator of arabinose operon